ncbi:MAG: phosphoglycerate mutase family protein [Lacibacter sp.]
MMRLFLLLCCSVFIFSCSRNTIYIVRHAEKAAASGNMMSSDVPLSEAGQQRATALKNVLAAKNVRYIFSTQTIRTTSTAKPLGELMSVPVQLYSPKDTVDRFVARVKSVKKGNLLIVGHSNTVDDLVNKMMKQNLLTDLPDAEYDNLFIIQRKGKKYFFSREKY